MIDAIQKFNFKNLIILKMIMMLYFYKYINPLASPSAGAPALKYGDVNTVTPSSGEAKGSIYLYS